MAIDIQFYELRSTPLERALPKLLEKAMAQGFRALVVVDSEEKAEMLNTALWTYEADAFLPHGTARDPHPEAQPIYITCKEENPNQADLLVITDGSEIDVAAPVTKILDIIEGGEESVTAKAHTRFRHYQSQGHQMMYNRQEPSGWQQLSTLD